MDKETLDIDILKKYPTIEIEMVEKLLNQEIKKNNDKIVVLDDDPTGVQTVHDISVYTDWSYESIRSGFAEKKKMFYILTNSRGFSIEQTIKVHHEIGQRIAEVAKEVNKGYLIVSRGDSTLRGHYPLETEILRNEIEKFSHHKVDGEILCPFFKEGGRYTIDNIHYVKYNQKLIPAGETEFAKDKTFGYKCSNLCAYIEEKTNGAYAQEDVVTISLEELRGVKLQDITEKLLAVQNFGKVVVNAIDSSDLKVFCIALYRAIAKGKRFLFRTAAGFVKELGGITDKPLLTRSEMIVMNVNTGGIIVVGSHTLKTTSQLEALKTVDGIEFIEFNSDLVLEEGRLEEEINSVISKEENFLREGITVVVYTKRKLLAFEQDTKEDALLRSVKISEAVQSLVGRLTVIPAFVIAKGGITSSDIGTKALHVIKANVLGQIMPGIPVWQTGEESKFPQIPYIIFPGNVGDETTLKEAVEVLIG
ncbi:MAG: hydroxyacid dehydrogenase [Firmicutes bacterium HGW-Firmicutes-7]|nr:MAG: hydroxyacid dehydrogenase [Firmicutes bacterium HGW-Firmicutes-7]